MTNIVLTNEKEIGVHVHSKLLQKMSENKSLRNLYGYCAVNCNMHGNGTTVTTVDLSV